MRILRRMSVLASYAKDPAVRPPGPDVPSVQAPAVRALNSDAGGYDHLGVAQKRARCVVVLFLSSVGRCSRTIAGGPGLNDGVVIKYVSILVDVCVSACAEAPSGDAHENEGQDHHENTSEQDRNM